MPISRVYASVSDILYKRQVMHLGIFGETLVETLQIEKLQILEFFGKNLVNNYDAAFF